MSNRYGPRIVTDGLVLCLDAADNNSYPGSGTAWNDLSGNNNNITLTNGPVFNSNNKGNIAFDGTNDYANFFAPNLSNVATVEMWCKISSATAKMFFGWLNYTVYCRDGNLGYNTFNGDVYGVSATDVTNLGLLNNWKQYIFEMRSDVDYTNNKIYVNTTLLTLSQQRNSENASNRNFNNGEGRIGTTRSADSAYFMPMNCAIFRVYNKILSISEISQNYNTSKGKFDL